MADSTLRSATERLKITFFCGSVIGYTADPAALPTRGLAQALAERGHVVRLTEQRLNPAFAQTLRDVGADAVRKVHDTFPQLQMHTWESRRGAPLLEWLTRELALIDVAVVVDGADAELTQWVGYVERRGLLRFFLHWNHTPILPERAEELHLGSFDHVFSPSPATGVTGSPLHPTLAPQDAAAGLHLPPAQAEHAVSGTVAAQEFERIVGGLFLPLSVPVTADADGGLASLPTNGAHPPTAPH